MKSKVSRLLIVMGLPNLNVTCQISLIMVGSVKHGVRDDAFIARVSEGITFSYHCEQRRHLK